MPFLHTDRRLNRGGALTAYDDELVLLHSAGVRAVVSLLNIPTDKTIYEEAGFNFICLPVANGGAPTMDQANQFVRFVEEQRSRQNPVAVHCEAGIGRTGTMLAVYLISRGQTAAQAIRSIRTIQPSAIETPRQVWFLEEYARRMPGKF